MNVNTNIGVNHAGCGDQGDQLASGPSGRLSALAPPLISPLKALTPLQLIARCAEIKGPKVRLPKLLSEMKVSPFFTEEQRKTVAAWELCFNMACLDKLGDAEVRRTASLLFSYLFFDAIFPAMKASEGNKMGLSIIETEFRAILALILPKGANVDGFLKSVQGYEVEYDYMLPKLAQHIEIHANAEIDALYDAAEKTQKDIDSSFSQQKAQLQESLAESEKKLQTAHASIDSLTARTAALFTNK